MNRRSWLKVAAGGLAAIAAWRPWRWAPPDVWVRMFHASACDFSRMYSMLCTCHPKHRDMVCRSIMSTTDLANGLPYYRVRVVYERIKPPDWCYRIGPDVPAHWVEVA